MSIPFSTDGRPVRLPAGPGPDSAAVVARRLPSRVGRRWAVLAIAFLAFLVTFLDRLAWANVGLHASATFGVSMAALGTFVTAFYAGYVVANVVGGVLTDRLGPRRLLVLSLAPLGLATIAFGQATTLGAGVALQAVMGVCAGADYAACVKVIAAWFAPGERGRALGLFAAAPSLGIALANGVFPVWLRALPWPSLYAALGVLTLAAAAACGVGLRDAPADRAVAAARPSLRALLRDRTLVAIALAGFGANWGTWGFAFWATTLMVRGHGVSAVDAGIVASVFGIAAIVSKPLYGLLSDLLGGRRRLLVGVDLVVFALMLWVFGAQSTRAGFLLAAPLLGVAAFVYSPLLAAMITEAAEPASTGAVTGAINAFWQLGSVVVPGAVGLVFATTASFPAAFAVLAAGPLAGAVCLVLTRPRR